MLTIDVYSDVICPWCYVGKRRLEKGLALAGQPATVRWHPFELNPDLPREGVERRAYRVKKFGSWERSLELDAQVGRAAAVRCLPNGGKSGLHRTQWWVTPTVRKDRESATERIPPRVSCQLSVVRCQSHQSGFGKWERTN